MRIAITHQYMTLVELFPWFIVNCLMLRIFSKYGKPLEDDKQKLIQTKLIEIFEQKKKQEGINRSRRDERRMEAYKEMAEKQMRGIIETMVAYTES